MYGDGQTLHCDARFVSQKVNQVRHNSLWTKYNSLQFSLQSKVCGPHHELWILCIH